MSLTEKLEKDYQVIKNQQRLDNLLDEIIEESNYNIKVVRYFDINSELAYSLYGFLIEAPEFKNFSIVLSAEIYEKEYSYYKSMFDDTPTYYQIEKSRLVLTLLDVSSLKNSTPIKCVESDVIYRISHQELNQPKETLVDKIFNKFVIGKKFKKEIKNFFNNNGRY